MRSEMDMRSIESLLFLLRAYRRKATVALVAGNLDRAMRLAERYNLVACILASVPKGV